MGHHKHWDWTNLDSRTVICVEPPHATTAGATCPHRATTLGGSLPCTLPHSASGSAASHSSSGAPIYLRPTNCPPAPRNSTQFIIDDHGGSGSSRSNNASPAAGASASAAAAPSSSSFAEDGDSQWAERDFQSVYETAHREEVSAWDRKRLCEEISALERRQKELVKVLARIDPEVYLQRLEAQVASLRETGARLKAGLRRAKET